VSAWDRFLRDLLEQWPLIWAGLGQTVILAAVISVTGLLAGILVFYLSISRTPWVRRVTQAYISFFIGMPLIVLLFLMYYGLPQWGVRVTPFWIAVVGFTLNIAAYNAGYMGTA
jgi:polar amino acid transport system permease protein